MIKIGSRGENAIYFNWKQALCEANNALILRRKVAFSV
jgi:hypothetical protein